jgi:hypothetical protein
MYNNLDRYLSVRQTEVKRDLTLAGKQEGWQNSLCWYWLLEQFN